MEKKTYELCFEILKKFEKAKILKHIILIGSWSIYFYQYYFDSKNYVTSIRTRDIDFLIPIPFSIDKDVDIFALIKDIGFIEAYKSSRGYIKLEHPDLTIEFLVPERGRGHNKPYPIPQLKTNAQPLRFLDFLVQNTIMLKADNLRIRVPHPAAYALHKFLIFKRRKKREKFDKDLEGALRVYHELLNSKEDDKIKHIFSKMHKKWQEKIISNLRSVNEDEIAKILEFSLTKK